jgi:hypothetical protein
MAVAVANVPSPVIVTVGTLVYPDPLSVTVMESTASPTMAAVAVAPVPPPPVIETVAAVYPEPPASTVIEDTEPPVKRSTERG